MMKIKFFEYQSRCCLNLQIHCRCQKLHPLEVFSHEFQIYLVPLAASWHTVVQLAKDFAVEPTVDSEGFTV